MKVKFKNMFSKKAQEINKDNMKYWDRINTMQEKQVLKGFLKYGQLLEENKAMDKKERIVYLQEELIDALMYCEHLKEEMSINEYQELALRTASSTNKKDLIVNGVMGLNGEAGECIDIVKKHMFQGHSLDEDKLKDELSDVFWYLAIAAKGLGLKLDDIAKHNVEKLIKRYPEGFDADKSINRAE